MIAAGAWLSRLAGHRARIPVQAGRGYSFTVPVDRPIPGPIYLPDVRVACTPYQGALRVSGTLEFRDPHEPADPERVGAIVASAKPLLDGVRWAERSDIWVGSRPVTPTVAPSSVKSLEGFTWRADTACGDWHTARSPAAFWPNT